MIINIQEVSKRIEAVVSFSVTVADFLKQRQENRELPIQKKGEIDIVTEADLHSEKLLIEFIQKNYPQDEILGEESGLLANSGAYRWIIDPLDGTTNYANFLPLYAISIGLEQIDEQELVGGLVVVPALGDYYHAVHKQGAFKNGRPIHVSQKTELINTLLCTGFGYHLKQNLDDLVGLFRHMLSITRGIRRTGSAALDLAWMAEGRFDGFWEQSLNPWDTSAGVVLIEEAGGIVSDFNGKRFQYNDKQILTGNRHLHSQFLTEIKKLTSTGE